MAKDDRAILLYTSLVEDQRKLNYFILALASTLFSYLANNDLSSTDVLHLKTINIAALSSVLISILFGFLKLDSGIAHSQLNFYLLDNQKYLDIDKEGKMHKEKGGLVYSLYDNAYLSQNDIDKKIKLREKDNSKLQSDMDKESTRYARHHRFQMCSLGLGFLLLLLSRVISSFPTQYIEYIHFF